MSRSAQIRTGGYYTIYVTPNKSADGAYRVTTTFKIGVNAIGDDAALPIAATISADR